MGAWLGYEAIEALTAGLGLPAWFPALAVVLFIIGLPIVLATAFVQEGAPAVVRRDPTLLPHAEPAAQAKDGDGGSSGVRRLLTWRNAIAGGLLAFALWGMIAAGWLIFGETPQLGTKSAASPTRIAVLPFSVRGDAQFDYLGDGMADVLSTKLDGAGELRTVDPRALLGVLDQEGVETLDPARGRAVARRFGAGLYVLGDVLEVGGRLRLGARLYRTTGGPDAVAEAAVEGEAEGIFDLVDDLATQLLGGRTGGPAERLTKIAALTTHSLPALKAYLEGESALRAGQFGSALDVFQQAVELDSTFALAWYRLSVAAEWQNRADLAQQAAERAFRHAERLSEHDRRLIEAFLAWRRGNGAEAERLYRAIVGSYPEDVEAWVQLGEVLFHHGPLEGRSISESREAWERTLSYEPEHVLSLWHLARIPAREGKRAELDSLVSRLVALSPEGDRRYEMLALRAFALGDTAAQRRVTSALRRASDVTLVLAVWNVATYSDDPLDAHGLARLMTGPSRSTEVRGLGHVWLAYLEVARGRWVQAKAELAEAERHAPAMALEYRALLSVSPFLPVPRAKLEAVRTRLMEWDASVVPASANPTQWFAAHNGLHSHLRSYLLGLVNACLGENSAAAEYAMALEGIDGSAAGARLAHDLARSVRAQVALSEGRVSGALDTLRRAGTPFYYETAISSAFYSQARERFVQGQLLEQLGRPEEALRWYASFAEVSVYDLAYLAPSHLRRAEIYERLGDGERAAHHYARFLELWQEPDPELRPMVEQARRGLSGLTGEARGDR